MSESEHVAELKNRILVLETQVKHLTNDLRLTREEYESSTKDYFEIHSSMEKAVNDLEERTSELAKTNDKLQREIGERRRAEKQAEAASLAKSQFVTNMSHEIRTPLNGIIGMIELVMDTDLDDRQRNIFRTITKEADSLFGIVNEILDFSKIEAGRLELDEVPFDLRNTFEDLAESIAIRAEQRGLELGCFVSPGVPSRLVGDPGKLRHILNNLSGNALKFTSEGAIYIKAEMDADIGDRVKVRFWVTDTGIGIPKDIQGTIFDSFTQVDGSTTRKYGGTGLGVTICKHLAEMMGGEIGVESKEGKGSTFWFTAVFSKQKGQKPILTEETGDLNDLRVLVADDNQTNRHFLMKYLKHWGCLTVEAGDGKEALAILGESLSSKEPFNLILADVRMPEINGFDLAKRIKTMKALKEIPIILITGVGKKGDDKTCTDIGVEGYLTKPVRQQKLRKAIEAVLGLSKAKEAQPERKLVTRHTIAEECRKEAHILLVEDYPANQMVALEHLRGAGHQVDLAENGQQAVVAYKREQYDLILMDIQMPVMDGFEATRKIRQLEGELKARSSKPDERRTDQVSSLRPARLGQHQFPVSRIPIVAMTAHAVKGYSKKCLGAGMDGLITKPLRRKQFLEMVDKWTRGIDNHQSTIINRQSNPQPPMNFEKAVEEFMGKEAVVRKIVTVFLDNVKDQIGTIRQAIAQGNAEAVRKEAHSIKGGAANLTADSLSRASLELEDIGRSGDLGQAPDTLDRLEEELHRLEAYAHLAMAEKVK